MSLPYPLFLLQGTYSTNMAVGLGVKVTGGVTLLITVIFGELYVYSLNWEAKARIYRLHFVVFIEAMLFLLSKFIWNNYSSMFERIDEDCVKPSKNRLKSLRKEKYPDADMYSINVDKITALNWTKWKMFLLLYLACCHFSYISNLLFLGREPNIFAFYCYAMLGLHIQIVTGLALCKGFFFIAKWFHNRGKTLLSRTRKLQIVLIYALSLWGYGLYNAYGPPTVKEVHVPISGLPASLNGMKIVQISDIHLGPTVGRWRLKRIVSIINQQNADIVVMTGDLVDGSVKLLSEAVEPIKYLKSKYGKYFITGNHEYYTGDVDNWFTHLGSLDFVVLHNDNVKLPREGMPTNQQICLAGTDDIEALRMGYGGHGMNLDTALGSCNQKQPVILLAHQPKAAKSALDSQYRVDLVISGHTHGGQFFPLLVLAYFANPFYHGLYKYGEASHVYVSMGTQYWGIPVRIGTTMEITRIILETS